MLKHSLDFVNYTVAWPWLKATGKPGLNLLKPLSLASAQGQNQAIITFAKLIQFTKLFLNLSMSVNSAGRAGLILAKATTKPTKSQQRFYEFYKLTKLSKCVSDLALA